MKNKTLKQIFSLSLIFLLTMNCATVAQKQPITPEALYSLARISEQSVSPDGKWVLYLESIPDIAENKMKTSIWVVSIDASVGEPVRKLFGDATRVSNPIWLPSENPMPPTGIRNLRARENLRGNRIAYISTNGNSYSIVSLDFSEEKPTLTRVATFNEPISDLAYSPNGKFFSFTKNVKIKKTIAEQYPNLSKANVRIYDELPIRQWDEWFDENVSHIFYMPVDGPANAAKDIMQNEPFGGNYGISWSPDSKFIAYSCKKLTGAEAARSTNSDVYVYDLESGTTENITKGMLGYDNYPKFSPNGQYISFCSQLRAGFESDRIRLMLYDTRSRAITEVTKGFDQWVTEYIWSNDSRSNSIYFVATYQGCYQVFNAKISRRVPQLPRDSNNRFEIQIDKFSSGQNDISGLSITADSETLVFGMCDMTRPIEICAIPTAGGDVKQITRLNTEAINKFEPSTFEDKWFDTRDGKKLHCWIIYPPNFDPNKKYPMITYCSGGPQQMISQAYGYRWNMSLLSAKGYVIVAPNRRGCPGYGQDWIDAISGDWGGNAMNDILDATDAMSKEKFIDKDKLVAIGASAGGYTTFWLAGNHEGRFKAFLSHNGLFNLTSFYGSTEELFFPDWDWGGPYWEDKNKAFYAKNSPSIYVDKWNTPIIISAGEMDFRVPYTQALEAFTVAQVKGIPSKLLVFPEMNHFIGKSQEYIVWYNEVFKFFDEHLNK